MTDLRKCDHVRWIVSQKLKLNVKDLTQLVTGLHLSGPIMPMQL